LIEKEEFNANEPPATIASYSGVVKVPGIPEGRSDKALTWESWS